MKVGIISLGCVRNLVDSEHILADLRDKGFKIVDIEDAELVIVNTCAFIKEATQESLDVIFELLELKKEGKLKKVVVAGCLPQRYKESLAKELKEVDAFMGRLSINEIGAVSSYKLTPKHLAYVKISEGCINKCSYCVIPQIKGSLTSRPIESIIKEIKRLDREKVSEINLIGQDIASYGIDLYKKPKLNFLLKIILKETKHFKWLRLLYTNPTRIDDELIGLIKNEARIVKYLDLPTQHVNDTILKQMNRPYTKKHLINLIDKLRKEIPQIAIRTSLIVGFPGEGDKEFKELLDFVGEVKFDRLGVFVYSREEGTPAHNFKSQVPEKEKKERFDILMKAQQKIAQGLNFSFMQKEMEVLIDEEDIDSGPQKKENIYLGRSYADAPEVDGMVYVHSQKKHFPGKFVKVKIVDTLEYDLVGKEI